MLGNLQHGLLKYLPVYSRARKTHFLDKQMPCQAPLYTQPEEPKECLERVAAD